ncbi:CPBP family intramembrane glutamic endopeptidase [uncultured Pseudomonas sp.]|uniref:CPBP family intramembrane glutamic endopeptidase n=1 Tax=uncultured Pseudomonas sp. TaxID=114707 RepID=UPI0025D0A219|nr:CPBP family intramembrane glutamic endopeptidase [uncultured Pseudomonas sp.]
MDALLVYFGRLIPALALFTAWLALTPRTQTSHRLLVLIIAFMFTRDLMTPSGLWSLGGAEPLRFHHDPAVLAALGLASLGVIALLARLLPECWRSVVGFKGPRLGGIVMGIAAGCVMGLPLRLYLGLEVGSLTWLAGFALLAMGGNALEEVLFRGMLQGSLEQQMGPCKAALGSAVAFSACHAYLAFVLTDIGWPILLFTFIEGLLCAFVRLKRGTVPAIATHAVIIGLLGAPFR